MELLQDHQLLHEVWAWLKLHQKLTEKGLLPSDRTKKSLQGVYTVLGVSRPVGEGRRGEGRDRGGGGEGRGRGEGG